MENNSGFFFFLLSANYTGWQKNPSFSSVEKKMGELCKFSLLVSKYLSPSCNVFKSDTTKFKIIQITVTNEKSMYLQTTLQNNRNIKT